MLLGYVTQQEGIHTFILREPYVKNSTTTFPHPQLLTPDDDQFGRNML
jgi:hypothetical protein